MTDPTAALSARQQRRREDLAAAVWRVLDSAGLAGLSMRAVAAQMDASTGVVTHHFSSKKELTTFALHLLAERSTARVRRSAEAGLPALRAALLDMLPLDAASRTANRIWVSSWDAALADAGHAADHAERYRASRHTIRRLLQATLDDNNDNNDDDDNDDDAGAGDASDASDAGAQTEVLHAAVLGLAVQAVLDPASYPAERQVQLLDELLARVTSGETPAGTATERGASGPEDQRVRPPAPDPGESTAPIDAHRDEPVPDGASSAAGHRSRVVRCARSHRRARRGGPVAGDLDGARRRTGRRGDADQAALPAVG